MLFLNASNKAIKNRYRFRLFKKKTFDKGYTQRWTEEVFKISKIQLTIPVTYKITDYNGEVNSRFVL